MKKSRILLLKQAGICICFLTILSCNSKQETEKQEAVLVRTQHIIYDRTVYHQEYIGTVESENAVDVSFLVSGNIEQMFVNEGQKVSKGQLLAKLNTATLKNTYDLAASSLKQAQDAYKRFSAMYESNSLSEIQYVDVKTKFEQAKANEAIAKKNLKDCTVYAPQPGVIGRRYLEPGTNVMPGTPVYNILDISKVKINVAIPEGEISSIHIGDACEVKISALENKSFEGKVLEKGVAANSISHTYDIKVQVNNSTAKIMPGMVCKTYLRSKQNTATGTIIIPIKAVQVDYSGKRFVWLKDKEGKATYKEVTLGKLAENGVQIKDGLQQGDELIVAGYQNISIGTPVSDQK